MSEVTVFGLAALPLALTIDRVANGVTRPMFGWISDLIGREKTMLIAFGMEAVAMTLWLMLRHDPVMFVVLSGQSSGGPLAALLHQHTGGWDAVFGTAIALDSCTAVLAIAALKPMRRAWLARQSRRA